MQNKIQESYKLLFTRTVNRAIHLELTNNLGIEPLKLTVRRFISRRGNPSCFISDNFKTFMEIPVSVHWWGLFDSPGKMSNFQKFSVLWTSRFSTGKTSKPTEDDMKIQRGELTNILRWSKNLYPWLTQKYRNGLVTLKWQENLMKYCINYQSIPLVWEYSQIYEPSDK